MGSLILVRAVGVLLALRARGAGSAAGSVFRGQDALLADEFALASQIQAAAEQPTNQIEPTLDRLPCRC
jgi:hypothetical protein